MSDKINPENIELINIIDLKFLQNFQDVFSKVTGFASLTINEKGPITKPSNFSDFCIKYTRQSPEGYKRCNECDIKYGKLSAEKGKPQIYKCHAGLTDFSVPIIVGDQYVGSILGGQVLTEPPNEEEFRKLARELNINEDEYIKALREIKIVDYEKIKEGTDLLFFVANTISDACYKNYKLNESNQKEAIVRKISEKIRSSLDINETLKFICEEVARLFNVQRATIVQFYSSTDYEKYTVKSEYKENEKIKGLTSAEYQKKAAAYWGRNLLKTGEIMAFNNIQKSKAPKYFKECYATIGVMSIIGIPIKRNNEKWGSLVLSEYNSYREWPNEEKNLLKTISDQIYIAINQAELYEKEKKIAQKEFLLRKIMDYSIDDLNIDKIKQSIVNEIGNFLNADRCMYFEYDPEINSTAPINYCEYLSSKKIKSFTHKLPDKDEASAIINVLKERDIFSVEDINSKEIKLKSKKMLVEGLSVKSFLIAPIYYGEKDYGALALHYVQNFKQFSQDDVNFIKAVANQVATVIHQTNLYSAIESNEKYIRKLLNNIHDGIITINDDFIIETCNPSVESIWGYSASEIIGKKLDLLLSDECTKDTKLCLRKKELLGIKKNSEEFPVEIDVSEINFNDKKATLLVVRDITERKKIDKMKNEFVSTVSHELRTPLTSLRGSLGLVISGKMGDLSDKSKSLLEIANNNCSRLINLINDILDIEKIEAGKMDFDIKVQEMIQLSKHTIQLNHQFAQKFNVSINLVQCIEQAFVKIDSNRIIQVITNLLSNAIKFSEPNSSVDISVYRHNKNIRVSITNYGTEIPHNFKSRIFQKFAQADSSDTRQKGGTGLGLSISKAIIEHLNGNIGFVSENNATTFYFELPEISK